MDDTGQIPYWGDNPCGGAGQNPLPPGRFKRYKPYTPDQALAVSYLQTADVFIKRAGTIKRLGEEIDSSFQRAMLDHAKDMVALLLQSATLTGPQQEILRRRAYTLRVLSGKLRGNPGDVHVDIHSHNAGEGASYDWEEGKNPPKKVRAGQKYIFRRSGFDWMFPEHCRDVEDGTPVVVTQLPMAPKPGTMGHVHISDARTGEFLGMCSMQSLSTQTDELERTGQVKFVRHEKKNPPAVEVYRNVIEIRAEKKDGKRYVHKFQKGSAIYGLPDGSLHIVSRTGKRLWKNFPKGDR